MKTLKELAEEMQEVLKNDPDYHLEGKVENPPTPLAAKIQLSINSILIGHQSKERQKNNPGTLTIKG